MRGPTEMDGYLDDEAATAEIKKFGWLHTGDIGWRDADGYFYITDRKRDMIISGGFNIFPFEVESALMEHASVQDCAVIGVPDEKWGEAVKACVQLKPGSNVGADELIAFAKEKLDEGAEVGGFHCQSAAQPGRQGPQARTSRTLLAGSDTGGELRSLQ
jgi:acyl-CoA synthetase (AMP-forming)/AMP-acid ligase II